MQGVTEIFFPSSFRASEDSVSIAARDRFVRAQGGATWIVWDDSGEGSMIFALDLFTYFMSLFMGGGAAAAPSDAKGGRRR